MYTGILILRGTIPAMQLMTKLLPVRTKVVASPIPAPLVAEVVSASVGQVPNSRTSTGFSFQIPLQNVSMSFFISHLRRRG